MQAQPPFAALRAFDAAARHLSFKQAAAELGLTPTAISHQIRQLEQASGRALFVRRTRRVELTDDGRVFAEAVAPALESLAAAYSRLTATTDRQSVTLGAGPIFAARRIVPRLGDFWTAHPGIDLKLHHSPLPVWQQMAQFDLAVAWGSGEWPDVESEPLLRIDLSPVLVPALLQRDGGPTSPEDLLSLPLLHHRNSQDWRQWLSAAGLTPPGSLPGTRFEDANVLLQAALSGRGVALGVLQLIEDDLAAGRLVQPFATSIASTDAYHLIYRPSALVSEPVAAVRQWLSAL